MNVQQPSQQSTPRQKRFSRRHILALSIVSLIALLLIVGIAWILLTQNVTQDYFLLGLVASIVTILLGPVSLYIWIIESSKKSSEQQRDAYRQQVPHHSIDDRGDIPFQVGHPLPRDAISYIERQADQDALRHLRKMEYIALIDPRQQGKTSLIIHLVQKLSMQNYTFVIFDLSEPKYQNKPEEEWYKALGDTILRELRFISSVTMPPLPINSTSWELFLGAIAKASRQAKQKTVIILDEIREIPSSYATPFFTVIRMVFNQRPLQAHYEYLSFIISGAFNPDELIRDEQVSKFIAQRIHLDDFDLAQVKQLVMHLRLSEELADVVARCIYDWTDGQPYLTQRVCQLLSGQVLPHTHQELSNLIDRLGRQLYDDQRYLRRIKRLHEKEPELFQYAQRIAYGNRPYFSSGLFDQHFRLAHIYGVIKADSEGYCRIRNRICEHALTRIITQPLP